MNRFIIVDGLPYLYAGGKAYAVRWDKAGFTVGAEVKLKSAPGKTYSDISIKAKCKNSLDSIGAEPEEKPEEVQAEAEPEEKPKRTRKKKNAE